MRTVRVDPRAAAEVEETAVWYERQRPGLGVEFLLEVQTTLAVIATGQAIALTCSGKLGKRGIKRVFLKRFPFAVVFMQIGTSIAVVAVAHFARHPEYWRTRI